MPCGFNIRVVLHIKVRQLLDQGLILHLHAPSTKSAVNKSRPGRDLTCLLTYLVAKGAERSAIKALGVRGRDLAQSEVRT